MVVVGLALWPGRAWADAPDRLPIPSVDLSIPAGACPFPVSFHVLENNEYTIDFLDAEGNKVRTIIQGQVVLEITNLATETSVIRNVSGPGTIIYADLLFVGRGSQLFFFFPGDLGPDSPGSMFINRGRVAEYLGEPRKIISQTGVQEDLCATLGGGTEIAATEVAVGEPAASEPAADEAAAGDESQIPLERLA